MMKKICFNFFVVALAAETLFAQPVPSSTGTPSPGASPGAARDRADATVPATTNAVTTKRVSPKSVDEKALNPQPLPPVDDGKSRVIRKSVDEKALNPQPLPPVDDGKKNVVKKSADEKALNPQPLPPEPPDRMKIVLTNGTEARLIGKTLMLKGAKGEMKATAGTYKTNDGRTLVVNARGEVMN